MWESCVQFICVLKACTISRQKKQECIKIKESLPTNEIKIKMLL